MSSSGTPRSPERTRRAILDAAARQMAQHGLAVSLSKIAAAAGVSKGGLLHHFPSREDLIRALGKDCIEMLRTEVQGFVDLSENRPGKMLRAYVRALCGGSRAAMVYFADSTNWFSLVDIPEIRQTIAENARWWEEQLLADGLAVERVQLVRRAAEGVAAAHMCGEADDGEVGRLRDLLLALTEQSVPLPFPAS
ncbi:MAG: TetR/AcrR family transcriptional regulator [Propionibacteriaceae bacterium]|nr:TetR/AcrR family transcriptional regulator [Propionibacteriaceae bacterium]